VTVFVPRGAEPQKLRAIEAFCAELVVVDGDDCAITEARARAMAERDGRTYVSPYNDARVIAGQGTIAVELLEAAGDLDAVFVPVGGGGLIAGIGTVLKAEAPGIEVAACSPERSPAMHASLEAGRIVDVECGATLSDGTRGGLEPGAITFEICRAVVDRSLIVSEEQIRAAIVHAVDTEHVVIEGAAAVALAGFLSTSGAYRGRRIAIILSGANIGRARLRDVLR